MAVLAAAEKDEFHGCKERSDKPETPAFIHHPVWITLCLFYSVKSAAQIRKDQRDDLKGKIYTLKWTGVQCIQVFKCWLILMKWAA